MPVIKKKHKIQSELISIPNIDNYMIIIKNNYNIQQLKQIIKFHKLKLSGNKNELINRVYVYLYLSSFVIKIQKKVRGHLQRKYNLYQGPAYMKREICVNDSDFFSLEDIKEIPYYQFFSFKDEDGIIYGFDIISLYNLISKFGNNVRNPYNRNKIPSFVFSNVKSLIRLSKLLKMPMEIDIKNTIPISNQKSLELRILDLFQNIDALGNYTDPQWFSSLNRYQILKFIRELMDIWNYRAQLTLDIKRSICPPNGDPFTHLNNYYLQNEQNLDNVKNNIIEVLEKMINTGIDNDSKSLGAYYILGALTLVNTNAAISLPWLYQSVNYI